MDKTAAILLILLVFFMLWAYNTGRASAILAIIKGQSMQQPAITSTTSTGSGSGGTHTTSCSGNVLDPSCIASVFSTIPVIGDVIGGIFG